MTGLPSDIVKVTAHTLDEGLCNTAQRTVYAMEMQDDKTYIFIFMRKLLLQGQQPCLQRMNSAVALQRPFACQLPEPQSWTGGCVYCKPSSLQTCRSELSGLACSKSH